MRVIKTGVLVQRDTKGRQVAQRSRIEADLLYTRLEHSVYARGRLHINGEVKGCSITGAENKAGIHVENR